MDKNKYLSKLLFLKFLLHTTHTHTHKSTQQYTFKLRLQKNLAIGFHTCKLSSL